MIFIKILSFTIVFGVVNDMQEQDKPQPDTSAVTIEVEP